MELEALKDFLRKKEVIYIYMVFALFVGGLQGLMIIPIFAFWFILVLNFIFKFNNSQNLDYELKRDQMLRLFFIFPLLEILIHLLLSFGLDIFSGETGNIIEHFLGALFFTLAIELYGRDYYKKSGSPQLFVAIVLLGVTSLFGVLNEFWEFGLRAFANTDYCKIDFCEIFKVYSGDYYYADTVKDMAINVIGGVVGVSLVLRKRT